MSARGEFKQFDRDTICFQGGGELAAILGRHGFVINGMRKEGGRSVGGDLGLVGIASDEFGLRIGSKEILPGTGVRIFTHGDNGVNQPGEIGPATQPFDGIGRSGMAGVEMRGGGGGDVATRGEAEYADAIRVDPPRGGVGAGEADGALSVE